MLVAPYLDNMDAESGPAIDEFVHDASGTTVDAFAEDVLATVMDDGLALEFVRPMTQDVKLGHWTSGTGPHREGRGVHSATGRLSPPAWRRCGT